VTDGDVKETRSSMQEAEFNITDGDREETRRSM
jgi:hypothetical protein